MPAVGPREFAERVAQALARGEWDSAAALADPASLSAWRERELAFLTFSQEDSGTPDSAQATLVAIPTDSIVIAKALDKYKARSIRGISGVRTLGDLAGLPAAALFARYCELITRMFRPAHRFTFSAVGEVLDGDTLAYVLYHGTLGPLSERDAGEVGVLTLRRVGDGWRYVLVRDLTTPSLSLLLGSQSH